MAHNRFTNPATGTVYTWAMNHQEEEATGKERIISRTANTGNVGAVRQQGDDGATVLKLTGKIMERSQLQQFWAWYELCRTQTIYFEDYDGQKYEVQITSFLPKRVRQLSHSGRDAGMPFHHYEYSMDLEVYRFIAGDMFLTGVTP